MLRITFNYDKESIMLVIELIERKVGDVDTKVIQLENLCDTDLNFITKLAGNMTDEIYTQHGQTNRVRNCDQHLTNGGVVRIVAVKECILLWTILTGNLRQRPHLDQLCNWLNETKHTHKGDLLLREREVHEVSDEDGPECLFGDSLEDAMKTAPRGGKLVESTIDPAHLGDANDMSDEDLASLFDDNCMDLHEDPKSADEKEVEDVLHTFFSPYIEGEQEILLIEEA
jgi:hypothetical protein